MPRVPSMLRSGFFISTQKITSTSQKKSRNSAQFIYARKKRGSISDAEFIEWKTEARSLLDKTRAGEMSEEDFETWLKQDVRAWGAFGKEK